MHTRPLRTLSCLLAAAITLAACGNDDPASTSASTSGADQPAASAPAETDGVSAETTADSVTAPTSSDVSVPAVEEAETSTFPVTIEHRMGSTTFEARPERIVSLNVQWTDAVLAMGEVPVAYMSSAAEPTQYPWQAGLLDGVEQIDGTDSIPFETIAALEPDLILVTFAVRDQNDYDLLSAIAPTIGMLGDLQVDPWDDQVEVLGRVLGDPGAATAAIGEVDSDVATVAAELPGLEGATYTFANLVPGDTIYVIADPDDGASALFNELGMVLDPDIVALDESAIGRVEISYEQVGLLGADLVGVLLNGQDPSTIVGLAELPSNQAGTLIEFEYADIVGLNTPTPLSVPYLLDLIRPSLDTIAAEADD